MFANFLIVTYDHEIPVSGCEAVWDAFKKTIKAYGTNRVFVVDADTGEVVADSKDYFRS